MFLLTDCQGACAPQASSGVGWEALSESGSERSTAPMGEIGGGKMFRRKICSKLFQTAPRRSWASHFRDRIRSAFEAHANVSGTESAECGTGPMRGWGVGSCLRRNDGLRAGSKDLHAGMIAQTFSPVNWCVASGQAGSTMWVRVSWSNSSVLVRNAGIVLSCCHSEEPGDEESKTSARRPGRRGKHCPNCRP